MERQTESGCGSERNTETVIFLTLFFVFRFGIKKQLMLMCNKKNKGEF